MSFWSTEKLRIRIPQDGIVEPYDSSRIKSAAYELSMGNEFFRTSSESGVKTRLAKGEQFTIPPGQLALLITDEKIRIPPDAIGFISIRAKIKFHGLVNISGFHVDPGFYGRLKFTVYNAGSEPITISSGDAIFLLWISSLDQITTDTHKGEHSGQVEISSDDVNKLNGESASPAALKIQLDELKLEYDKRIHKLETNQAIAITLLVGLILALLPIVLTTILTKGAMPEQRSSDSPPSSNSRNPGPATPQPLLGPVNSTDAGSLDAGP